MGGRNNRRCNSENCGTLQNILQSLIGKKVSIFTVELSQTVGRISSVQNNLVILENAEVFLPNGPLRMILIKTYIIIGRITQVEVDPDKLPETESTCNILDCTALQRALEELDKKTVVSVYTNENDQTIEEIESVRNNLLILKNAQIQFFEIGSVSNTYS